MTPRRVEDWRLAIKNLYKEKFSIAYDTYAERDIDALCDMALRSEPAHDVAECSHPRCRNDEGDCEGACRDADRREAAQNAAPQGRDVQARPSGASAVDSPAAAAPDVAEVVKRLLEIAKYEMEFWEGTRAQSIPNADEISRTCDQAAALLSRRVEVGEDALALAHIVIRGNCGARTDEANDLAGELLRLDAELRGKL